MFEDEDNVIKITSKGASGIGLMLIKETIKELEMIKRRFLSLRSLVSRLDQGDADRILLFVSKEGLAPIIGPMNEALLSLSDDFLEPLREALIQKKIKTWQEAVALFEESNENEECIQCSISNIQSG